MLKWDKKILILLLGVVFLAIAVFIVWPQKKVEAPKEIVVPDNNLPDIRIGEKCGFENCHGLNLSCGENVSEMCTMEYQLGDGCRKYARCEVQKGQCEIVKRDVFDECKGCVEKCEEDVKGESEKAFECERECYKKINGTEEAELE